MDSTHEQSLVWARFEALRIHPPPSWDEDAISQFHEIVTALEEAYTADLSSFRVPDAEMKRRTVGGSRPSHSGRFQARKQMSSKRYCDGQFVRRQMDGIVLYFRNLQPSPERKKLGF